MATTTDYTAARTNMVEGQIRPNKVTDFRLVDAFLSIPRELFVPKALRGIAYVDEDIQIGGGRFLTEPMVLARLLQEVRIGAQDVALVIGCATGYSVAIAAGLAATVVGVESDAALAASAGRALQDAGIDNAIIMQGPLEAGWPKQGPYDVIVLDGAVAEVPTAIFDQLAEGGRLSTVVRNGPGMGEAWLYQKVGGVISGRPLFDAAINMLPGFAPKPSFVF